MPTRDRSTTENEHGETDGAGLVADAEGGYITWLFRPEMFRARKPRKTALPRIVRCLSEWDGAVKCPERSYVVARMVSRKGLTGRCKRYRVIPDSRRDKRPMMSSQPPYQIPPQGYGPNQPQGGWEQRQYPRFRTPTYGMPGGLQSPGSRIPLFAGLAMRTGMLSLIGPVGLQAATKAFGIEIATSGMDARTGVFTLLLNIAIAILAGLSGFLPAMKRLFWSMVPTGALRLINLIMVPSAVANIGEGTGQYSGPVWVNMKRGLILLLISSITVITLATIHVIQMLSANRRVNARLGFGRPDGLYRRQRRQQRYQGQEAPGQQVPNGYGTLRGGYGQGGYSPQGGYGGQQGGFGGQQGGYGQNGYQPTFAVQEVHPIKEGTFPRPFLTD